MLIKNILKKVTYQNTCAMFMHILVIVTFELGFIFFLKCFGAYMIREIMTFPTVIYETAIYSYCVLLYSV